MTTCKRVHSTILFVILVFFALATPCSSRAARAQPSGAASKPGAEASADELFDQAQAAFKAGDLQRAYEAYLAAWRIQKSYDIAGNLGNVEMKLGKLHDAAGHLSYALRSFPPTGSPAQKSRLAARFEEARIQVAAVRVVVNRPNATITLDGAPLGVSPLDDEVFVTPGPHTIEAKLWGHEDAHQKITAAKGSSQIVTLTLNAAAEPQPEAGAARVFDIGPKVEPKEPLEPPDPSAGSEPVMIGGFTVSGVFAVTGGILLGVSASLRADEDAFLAQAGPSGCYRPQGTNIQACEDLNSTVETRRLTERLGIVATVVGAAGVVGTVTYVLVWRYAPLPPEPQVVALPTCSSTACGFMLTGKW
jgi:hypothetical protein